MLGKLCNAAFWLYVLLSALSLLIIPLSERGLFGIARTPLAGVFAALLAQPWLSLLPEIGGGDRAFWGFALVAVCLCVNAAILRLICCYAAR